ncbi:MAG TPA: hypothetical protein VLX30_14535 [Burkholderiales bacterium]|nr:hypothetical protein [Burkholderiales bacterium]
MNDVAVPVFSTQNRIEIPIYPLDVYTRTDSGNAQIGGRATQLPAQASAVLAALDGKRTVAELELKLPHIAPEVVRGVLRALLSARLARAATLAETGDLGVDFAAFFGAEGEHEARAMCDDNA